MAASSAQAMEAALAFASPPGPVQTLPRSAEGQLRRGFLRGRAAAADSSGKPSHGTACALVGAAAAAASVSHRRSSRLSFRRAAEDDLDLGLAPELVVKVPGYDKRKTGILLLNIGTPASTSVDDVREYLDKFLADDRVIEIQPALLKWLILQGLLISRPKSSAENYKKIWDPVRGSPLLFHSQDLAKALQEAMGDQFLVRIGMQYSAPTVDDSLKELAEAGVDNVVLVPMFPHYASGTTGSCLAGAYRTAAELYCTPFLSVLPPFYGHRLYVQAMRQNIQAVIGPKGQDVDHTLFSFHGLPEEQCSRTDTTGTVCNKSPNCCAQLTIANRNCYRAQCFETARLLAHELGLDEGKWSIGFQSRLTLRGAIQWIKPYTDEAFVELAKRGVRKLAVAAPSFTADCVETLEELGITGREEFAEAGGEEIVLVPCLNSSDYWVSNLDKILREFMAESAGRALQMESSELIPKDDGKSMVPDKEVGVST
mmetsp:Transcript_90656/g.161420  ORF Transcript_90656/g.161420 Transcript_90656/m.161420 type:complete len:484 (-) Transcript_90656:161-1612(-)|eukprot:CAMPEP_0197664786 /NCGR_PEP_ID=MMETSP1338-20131121/58848_1 /TAXON_ID=43686 ORGANISM="Pelagodinium beii, Strain RCC1491" /NCGR_SAMPLE_ID=MMETSP1338 /ASSEMBLY_ACC=CAM_ASM_000754 /LENGTH=483 /DNA_ID=CAMNT_0043243497 /DNA_START=47 /DNA_END=1498 /DNA_ORIENTATION=-